MNYNVKKLQMVIGFVILLMNDLREKLADGKLSVIEIIQLLPFLKDLSQLMQEANEIKKAYLSLKPEEKAILINYFQTEFNLPNATTEKMIESFFETLIGMSGFFAAMFVAQPNNVDVETKIKEF